MNYHCSLKGDSKNGATERGGEREERKRKDERTKLRREFEGKKRGTNQVSERMRESRAEDNCRKRGSLVRHYPQSNPQFQVRRKRQREAEGKKRNKKG